MEKPVPVYFIGVGEKLDELKRRSADRDAQSSAKISIKTVPSTAAAVPARTPDLAGLPPAFMGVGTIDLFFDEDVDYAQRLNNAGVPTELIVVPGGFHGFDNMPGAIGVTQRFNAAKLAALRKGMGIPAAG